MRSTVHHAHAHEPPGDDDPTFLFQRNLPGQGERCTICPFNRKSTATDRPATIRPSINPPHHPATSHPSNPPHRPAPTSRPSNPSLRAPANTGPAMLPRPALLAADLRGSGTLVLPDALRSTGPDAATIEQPQTPAIHPIDSRRPPPGMAARDPDFDELASPDITVFQNARTPTIRPVRPRRPARVSTRAYLALNICLGLLIVAGLVLLAIRDVPSAAPGVSASE